MSIIKNKKKSKKSPKPKIVLWPGLKRSITRMSLGYGMTHGTTVVQCPVCLNTHVCNKAYNSWDKKAGCQGNIFLFSYAKGPRYAFDVGPKKGYGAEHKKTRMRARTNLHKLDLEDKNSV